MPANRTITRADLLSVDAYAKVRKERRQALVEKKKSRRLEVGPVASFLFESYDSMWLQVQEMLYIERGGDAQIDDELAAYNPLVPQGDELVATVLFEIDEPERRKSLLGQLGGVEETAFMSFAGETVEGRPEGDMDRSTDEGKASAVSSCTSASRRRRSPASARRTPRSSSASAIPPMPTWR